MGEWEVKIDLGGLGMGDLSFTQDFKNTTAGNDVMVEMGSGDMFTISQGFRGSQILVDGRVICNIEIGASTEYIQFIRSLKNNHSL